jgi:predicted permease
VMIILGGSLYLDFRQKGKIYYWEIVKLCIIKNFAFPLAVLGVLVLIDARYALPYGIALMFIMQAAVPPITGTPIMTERAGGNKSISNQFVLSSFVLSIISIPIIFQLFSHFFPIP